MDMSRGYKVRITAGGRQCWLTYDLNAPFSDDEAVAYTFRETMGDFNRYVLNEAEGEPYNDGKTLGEVGIDNIEFIFVKKVSRLINCRVLHREGE